jgi:2-polyprenyl-6-methoxyphenol hydroxylase-like FAD-dependent oxidoreductase
MVRITIIGGGIGGLTTAIALRQAGFEPEVYEQAPLLLDIGAAIAIWPNAMRVMQRLGLAEQILERAGVMREIRWIDSDGRLINTVSIADRGESSLTPALALHRADLQELLLESLPKNSVHLGNSLVDYNAEGNTVTAHFANGHTVESDFLIGADGIHSHVRTQLLDDASPVYRGYMVWRGISQSVPSAIPPGTAIEVHGTGKRFGVGPVGAGRVGWWASANAANTSHHPGEKSDRKMWKHGESVPPQWPIDTRRELMKLFDGWYRPVLQLIEATPSSSILRTGAFDRRPDQTWGSGRVTLLGDAIHPTTPNLGQGGCMAIEDAMILARCFKEYGPGENALRSYEQLRLKRTSAVAQYSRVYGSVGQWENIFARALRRSVLSLVPESVALRLMEIVFSYDACEVKLSP